MQLTAGKTNVIGNGSLKPRKLTGKALWPFFWDVPTAIGQAGHIELLHQVVPPAQGEVAEICMHLLISLEVGVV